MIEFKINSSKVLTSIERRAAKAKQTAELMKDISSDLESSTEKNFRSEGRPKWKKLAESTLEARRRQGKTGRILQVSGQLKNSITTQSGYNFAKIGTNLKYARIHQFGGTIKQSARSEIFTRRRTRSGQFARGTTAGQGISFGAKEIKIPARPFIKLLKSEKEEIVRKVKNWFK